MFQLDLAPLGLARHLVKLREAQLLGSVIHVENKVAQPTGGNCQRRLILVELADKALREAASNLLHYKDEIPILPIGRSETPVIPRGNGHVRAGQWEYQVANQLVLNSNAIEVGKHED